MRLRRKIQGDVILSNFAADKSPLVLPEDAALVSGSIVAGTTHKHFVVGAELLKSNDVL